MILEKMRARGITPKILADFDEESRKAMEESDYLDRERLPHQSIEETVNFKEHKKFDLKKIIGLKGMFLEKSFRIAGIGAACMLAVGVIILAPKIDAIAKKRYQYQVRVESGERGRIVWNNQENYITEIGSLEKAYIQIKEELGISVLKLNYIPEGMRLLGLDIEGEHVRIEFTFKGNHIYMFEVSYPIGDIGAYSSDRKKYKSVFNELIGQDIPIQRNKTSEGNYEYSAYFELEDSHYILEGILEESEFINIIKNLTVEN
ncbi:MAG: DUF4367 domain-containing protein [Lachnospiraceae bacterium]|nr:DUF4367 domain-containing protein [Lachnospiraceae bacterium]